MENAIKKSIEGGWKWNNRETKYEKFYYDRYLFAIDGGSRTQLLSMGDIVIDPLFWQAVGKAEGWGITGYCWGCGYDEGATSDTPEWLVNWHHFIDKIASGGTAEEFFEELLK